MGVCECVVGKWGVVDSLQSQKEIKFGVNNFQLW